MSGHLHSALVRGCNRSRKFRRRDEHVSLEIVYALIHPVIGGLRRVLRPSELVQLHRKRSRTFKIGTGHVYLRPWSLPSIDLLLQFEIGIRLKRSGRSDRGHASGKIKARKTVSHLAKHAVSHGIEHVIVHAYQARDDTVSVQI